MSTLLEKLPEHDPKEYSKEYLRRARQDTMFIQLIDHQIKIRTKETDELMQKGGLKEFELHCLKKYEKALERWTELEKQGLSYGEIEEIVLDEIICPEKDYYTPELGGALNPEDQILLADYMEVITTDLDNF